MPILKELTSRKDAAHSKFSVEHGKRQAADVAFSEVARRREALRQAGDDAERKLTQSWASALADTIEDPTRAAESVASHGPMRDAVVLLRDAEKHHAAFIFADAKRKTLSTRVDELAAQVEAESARLEHHEAALAEALRAASELEGGLSVQVSGGTADRLRELIAKLSGELTRARAALVQHDTETETARAALEE